VLVTDGLWYGLEEQPQSVSTPVAFFFFFCWNINFRAISDVKAVARHVRYAMCYREKKSAAKEIQGIRTSAPFLICSAAKGITQFFVLFL
jgi:hypothetical protein